MPAFFACARLNGVSHVAVTGDEIIDLLNGKKPNRESVLEPTGPRTSAVPPAGKPRRRPDPDAGLEPQPQASAGRPSSRCSRVFFRSDGSR
jgi:hypothetical protein